MFLHLYIYILCCTSYVSEGVTSYPRSATGCSCPVEMFMFTLFPKVICSYLVKMFKREMFARAVIEHLHKQVCRQELLTCLFKMFTKQVAMLICLCYKSDLSVFFDELILHVQNYFCVWISACGQQVLRGITCATSQGMDVPSASPKDPDCNWFRIDQQKDDFRCKQRLRTAV